MEERVAWKHTGIGLRVDSADSRSSSWHASRSSAGHPSGPPTSWSRRGRPSIARTVGEHAEKCRVEIARDWLGRELPNWPTPCPIRVKLTGGRGRRTDLLRLQRRPCDRPEHGGRGPARPDPRLRTSARDHAHHLRRVLRRPDAAVGGRGSVAPERGRARAAPARQIAVDLLARRGEVSLGRLFQIEEYPKDLMSFYGQGYSISTVPHRAWEAGRGSSASSATA